MQSFVDPYGFHIIHRFALSFILTSSIVALSPFLIGGSLIASICNYIRARLIVKKDEILFQTDDLLALFKFHHREIERHGFLIWQKMNNFDIKDYIIEHDKVLADEQEVQEVLSYYDYNPPPPDRSPWRFILLQKADNKSVLLCQIRHTIGDGVGLMRLLMSKLADFPVPPSSTPSRHKNSLLLSIMKFSWRIFLDYPIYIWSTLVSDDNSLQDVKTSESFNFTWTKSFELLSFKSLKSSGCFYSVNDVLVASIANALSKYIMVNHMTPVEPDISVLVAAAMPKISGDVIQNHMVAFKLPVSLSEETSAAERLEQVNRKCSYFKTHYPLISMMVSTVSRLLLPIKLIAKGSAHMCAGCTCMVTNLPGPADHMTMAGYPVEDVVFYPPALGNVGLIFSVLSYSRRLRVCIKADKSIIHNVRQLKEFIEETMEEYLAQ